MSQYETPYTNNTTFNLMSTKASNQPDGSPCNYARTNLFISIDCYDDIHPVFWAKCVIKYVKLLHKKIHFYFKTRSNPHSLTVDASLGGGTSGPRCRSARFCMFCKLKRAPFRYFPIWWEVGAGGDNLAYRDIQALGCVIPHLARGRVHAT